MNAIITAGTGLIRAENRFVASAQRVAGGQGDFVADLVQQASDEAAFKASLAVAQAGDDMIKHLLDIKV